jgi:hypothetical protein
LIRYSIFFAFITTFIKNKFSIKNKNNKLLNIIDFNNTEIYLTIMLLIYLLSFIDYDNLLNNLDMNISLFPSIIEGKKNRKKKRRKKNKSDKNILNATKMLNSFKTMDKLPTQIDIEQLNDTMKIVNETVSCGEGTECFKQKKIESLKENYLEKKRNIEVAPVELKEARKEYYIYSFGEQYYNDKEGEILSEEGNNKLETITKNINSEFNQLDAMNNSYLNLFNYTKSLKNLFDNIKDENDNLKEKIQEKLDTAFTTKRKVYYEDIEIDKNEFYINLLKFLYFILIITYIFLSIYYKKFKRNNIIFIFSIIIFPYISMFIMTNLLKQIHYYLSKLPK